MLDNKKGLYLGIVLVAVIFIVSLMVGFNLPKIGPIAESEYELIKVEVHFTGNSEPLVGYVKELKLGEDTTTVYQGGSSIFPMYDVNGNLISIFNYARVEYIKILQ